MEQAVAVNANETQTIVFNAEVLQGAFVLQAVEEVNGNERLLASTNLLPGGSGDDGAVVAQNFSLNITPQTSNVSLRLSSPSTIGNVSTGVTQISSIPVTSIDLTTTVLIMHKVTVKVNYLEQEQFTVTLCDSIEDKYRFGFNGMEKDNEMKGIGNSLDFGARMYDSRVGRFMGLDPLAKNFPSESNYIYAGNSPILFIDKDGEKKKTYHYIIDLRDNSIKIPNAPVVSDGLVNKFRRHYSSAKEYWEFFDYSVNQVTLIDYSGKKTVKTSQPYDIDYSKPRSWSILPAEFSGRMAAGESAFDWSGPTKEWSGKSFDGLNFTTRSNIPGVGSDNKYNKSGTGKSINIDDLLSVLGVAGGAASVKKPTNIVELIKYVNDVGQTINYSQELAPIKPKSKPKPEPNTYECIGCRKTYHGLDMLKIDQDGKIIDTIKATDYEKKK